MAVLNHIALAYLAATAVCWAWGLLIRFRWDGVRLHVFLYHLLASCIGIDIYANTLTAGKFGETISGRLGLANKKGLWWGRIGAHFLGDLQHDHCDLAIIHDAERAREALKDLGS